MSLEDYIPFDKSKPDHFEAREVRSGFSFPCCACAHKDRPESECIKCAHYAN